jgi:hypothetical protein
MHLRAFTDETSLDRYIKSFKEIVMTSQHERRVEVLFVSLLAASGFGCAGGSQQLRESTLPSELATLEVPHQRQGAPLPPLAESARPATPHRVSYRVCVDGAQGKVIDVQPLEASPAADQTLLPALRTAVWQVPGLDEPACFLENFESSADGTWRSLPRPYLPATTERVPQASDANPDLPDAVKQRFAGKSVVGFYRMCLSKDSGAVSSVTPVVGIPGADPEIATVLRNWRYKPTADAACWIEPLMFTMNAAPDPTAPSVNAMPTPANSSLVNKVLR